MSEQGKNQAKAYKPYVPAIRPGSSPGKKPIYRVLVHRQYKEVWGELVSRVGLGNAQQFWDHVAMTPGKQPKIGSSTVMKGKHNEGKWPGYSKTIHYEISGAGRIDYQYNSSSNEGSNKDPHGVVKILTIDLSSH